MHRIPLPEKHHPIPRRSRNLYRVVPSLLLFPALFRQGFLGRTSTRCSSRKEGAPQPRIGFLRDCNMDCHCCLHLVGIDEESLRSEILSLWYGARGFPSGCIKPRRDRPVRVLLESGDPSRCYRGIFVVHRDRAGEEGDLATRRAISAKFCYSMVSSTLVIDAILPNPDAFAMNRRTIRRRYPFVFFLSIGVVPITSWIWTTELTVWFWATYFYLKAKKEGKTEDFLFPWINDTEISPSFGQVCL